MPITIIKNTVKTVIKLTLLTLIVILFIPIQLVSAGTKNLTATISDTDTEDSPATANYEVSTGSNFSTQTTSGSQSVEMTNGNGSFSKAVELHPITDKTYYWRSKATDKHGAESSWLSASFSIKGEGCTANTTPPDKINNLKAVAGNKQISLKWTNPAEITTLKLYRSETPGGMLNNVAPGLLGGARPNDDSFNDKYLITTFTGSTTTSYTDKELVNGTTYYYAIKASNECNKDSKSNEASAKPGDSSQIMTLTATCQEKQIDLTWNNPTKTNKVKLYRSTNQNVEQKDDNLIKTIDNGTETTYSDSSPTIGLTYFYISSALDKKDKELNKSEEISSATCSATPIQPPTNVTVKCVPYDVAITSPVEKKNCDLTIGWTDPVDANLNSIIIYRSDTEEKGEKIAQITKGVQWYKDVNVALGQTYYYVLQATDGNNRLSAETAPVSGKVSQAIDKPIQPTKPVPNKTLFGVAISPVMISAARKMLPFSFAIPLITSLTLAGISQLVSGYLNGFQLARLFHLLLGGWTRKKRQPWGLVLAKTTEMPVAGANVSLTLVESGRIIKTIITDSFGRYGFLIKKPGIYKISADATGYDKFVSQTFNVNSIATPPQDMLIHLRENLTNGISSVLKIASALLILGKYLNYFRLPIMIIGSVIAIYQVLVLGDITSWIIIFLYIFLWVVEAIMRLSPKTHGIVKDDMTNKPLDRVIIRLFKLTEGGKTLVATTLTGPDGMFRLLLAPGNYQYGAIRIGYQPYTSVPVKFSKANQLNVEIRIMPIAESNINNQSAETVNSASQAPLSEKPPEPPKPEQFQAPQPKQIDNGVDLSLPE